MIFFVKVLTLHVDSFSHSSADKNKIKETKEAREKGEEGGRVERKKTGDSCSHISGFTCVSPLILPILFSRKNKACVCLVEEFLSNCETKAPRAPVFVKTPAQASTQAQKNLLSNICHSAVVVSRSHPRPLNSQKNKLH